MENIHQQELQVVKVVMLEHMDQMKRIVNVHHVDQENTHYQGLKNAIHVIRFVEVIVLHQQENVINVLQDMGLQVVLVQHVDQENFQQVELLLVHHVQQHVIVLVVILKQVFVRDAMLDIISQQVQVFVLLVQI